MIRIARSLLFRVIPLTLALGSSSLALAQMPPPTGQATMAAPMVGGAAMSPQRDIVDNAMRSKDHTTLVQAIKQAGLVQTLKGPGPFTVFAPTNEAFAALAPDTLKSLQQPAMAAQLRDLLTYHVVPGRLDTQALKEQAQVQGGKVSLTTVQGQNLTVQPQGDQWTVTDAQGNTAHITIADVYQSNGVIFVVDRVLMPTAASKATP